MWTSEWIKPELAHVLLASNTPPCLTSREQDAARAGVGVGVAA